MLTSAFIILSQGDATGLVLPHLPTIFGGGCIFELVNSRFLL